MKHSLNKNIIETAEQSKAVKYLTNKRLQLIISIFLAFALIFLPFFLSVSEKKNLNNYEPGSTIFPQNADTSPKVFITAEEYSQIAEGMSFDEVCSIIGGEGELIQTIDLGMGDSLITKIYEWKSETDETAVADIVFKNGVVLSKTQGSLIEE